MDFFPPRSRSFLCCSKNGRPWDRLRNISSTSFEASLRELWVHRRTRQCRCCGRIRQGKNTWCRSKASQKPRRSYKVSETVGVVTLLFSTHFLFLRFSLLLSVPCSHTGSQTLVRPWNTRAGGAQETVGSRAAMTGEGVSVTEVIALDFWSGDPDSCPRGLVTRMWISCSALLITVIPEPGIVLGTQ